MYISGYFFQKGHFKNFSKKGTLTKNFWRADDPPTPTPPPSTCSGVPAFRKSIVSKLTLVAFHILRG